MNLDRYIAKNPPAVPLRKVDATVVVVIPAHREVEHLASVLNSLELPRNPQCHCVVVVNGEADADTESLRENAQTLAIARSFEGVTALDFFSPGAAFAPGHGGVGAARRVGLDWALAATNDPDVRFANLDADSPADPGYLDALMAFTGQAGLVHYEHDLPDGAHGDAIIEYETWMRYVGEGLRQAGSPYAYQNLGSIIVCTAAAYVRAAGMPRRAGAEDFHFIQKLHKTSGPLASIPATVRPSSRISARVPFGTGPAMGSILRGESDYSRLESPAAFGALGALFAAVPDLQRSDEALATLPEGLDQYLADLDAPLTLSRLRTNHRGDAFQKAFHGWFDGLRARQFLRQHGERVDAASAIAQICGLPETLDARARLLALRASPWNAHD